MDAKVILEQFHDSLAPRLDTYEQAIYLYVLRHSRLQSIDEIVIGFKSARRKIALGIGEKGKPISEGTCYEKLRSLQSKGCIEIVGSEQEGTRLRLRLPTEIPGIVSTVISSPEQSLEEADFFAVPAHRAAILRRESNQCFYCLRALDQSTYIIEHVSSRPEGDNGYRNVVAACRACNNRKGATAADDFLRNLYRDGFLNADDLRARVDALGRLRAGELKPVFDGSFKERSSFAV